MDASLHPWFGRSKTTSIPQAKGRIEPTVSNTTVTPADHIPEMFMPRKAFDNELRHERLICREAKVICCCLPPPRLMSQEPRCQMHRGITFHWLHRTKAPIDRCYGWQIFLFPALALFWLPLARFSGTFFYEIIFSDSNIQKTFLHTRFYTDAFQNEARNAKSIRRPLPDIRIFSNIFLYLIILLLFPPSFFCFCLQKRRFPHIWNIWHPNPPVTIL